MSRENFEEMLTGGHPNSLGNTIKVVEIILKDKSRFDELYHCYFSEDEVVRLRVSNAMKRICKEHPEWLVPYLDKFLEKISKINQASTQWTLSQLFLWLEKELSPVQKDKAIKIMQTNLDKSNDWIVQNATIETLGIWSKEDAKLKSWLIPRLEKFAKSSRKSVSGRAKKMLVVLAN
jgi:HEAT repeat protein